MTWSSLRSSRANASDTRSARSSPPGAVWRSCIRLRHAFELARQRVETIVDGGEILASGVIVVFRLPV